MARYKLHAGGQILDTETMSVIPADPANRQFQEFSVWVEEGGTPDPEFTPEQEAEQARLDEVRGLQRDLKITLHWLFRMILEVWEVGIAKGLWTNADITDTELKQKAADWKTKLDRLNQLGE